MIDLAVGIILAFIVIFCIPIIFLPFVFGVIATSAFGLLSGIGAFVVSFVLIAAFGR